jgi:hypothetical protein
VSGGGVRGLAKRWLSENTRHAIRSEAQMLSTRGIGDFVKWNALLVDAVIRERAGRHRYRELTTAQLVASRRSDTVFIFGSGYSLNAITAEHWSHIAAHDTFGFTAFTYQNWVRTDFHLIRGGVEGSLVWRAYAEDFCRTLNDNPRFADTTLILQGEYFAMFANQILGYGLIRPGTRIYRYRTRRGEGAPSLSFGDGIRHAAGTLCDAVNVAVCMGWPNIVLAGVDLYDTRYFWLPPDETYGLDPETGLLNPAAVNHRGSTPADVHNTARNGVVRIMSEWRTFLERERGIRLSVFNPRSLLADVMPVYQPSS